LPEGFGKQYLNLFYNYVEILSQDQGWPRLQEWKRECACRRGRRREKPDAALARENLMFQVP